MVNLNLSKIKSPEEFTPSVDQEKIREEITTGQRSIIINAVAGSGKTTTLLWLAKLINSQDSIFLAFNKSIQREIEKKLSDSRMISKTIHSLGYSRLLKELQARPQTDHNKYKTISERIFRGNRCIQERHRLSPDLKDELKELQENVENYRTQCLQETSREILEIIKAGEELARIEKLIDFTDMLWLPYLWNLPACKFSWIFLDECQDLSPLQLNSVLAHKDETTRFVSCGDPRQSIYLFAGADSNSFYRVKQETNAIELPLSTCYRCPVEILDLAREIVQQIEPKEGAIAGEINRFRPGKIGENLEKEVETLILSRKNGVLFQEFFRLLANGHRVKIAGNDIAKSLISLVSAVESRNNKPDRFAENLEEYIDSQICKLRDKADKKPEKTSEIEQLIDNLRDKQSAMITITKSISFSSLGILKEKIKEICDIKDESIKTTLSSIHRAKGLEANTVFILDYCSLPMKWKKQTAEQAIQETNLKYVALTRTKEKLFLVDETYCDVEESMETEDLHESEPLEQEKKEVVNIEPDKHCWGMTEVAKYTGIKYSTLRQFYKVNVLPTPVDRIGNKNIYKKEDLDLFVEISKLNKYELIGRVYEIENLKRKELESDNNQENQD